MLSLTHLTLVSRFALSFVVSTRETVGAEVVRLDYRESFTTCEVLEFWANIQWMLLILANDAVRVHTGRECSDSG